jgi:hypothetical protein
LLFGSVAIQVLSTLLLLLWNELYLLPLLVQHTCVNVSDVILICIFLCNYTVLLTAAAAAASGAVYCFWCCLLVLLQQLQQLRKKDDRRMTKVGFRRQAEGIANGDNLPNDYLDAIYDRIKNTPISLKESQFSSQGDGGGGGSGGGASGGGAGGGANGGGGGAGVALGDIFASAEVKAGRRKQEAYSKEREVMVRESELAFNQV